MAFDDDQSPPRLFQKLRDNAEFRKLFATRARQHFTKGGALTPERSAERYRQWANAIDSAVVAESARWGDYRRDAHRYKTEPYNSIRAMLIGVPRSTGCSKPISRTEPKPS